MTEKVIIITGASKGIGKAIAVLLGKENQVIIVARNQALLNQLERLINDTKGNAYAIRADVTKEEDVQRVVKEVITKFGTIDVLINNAGIGKYKRVDKFTLDEFNEIYQVNVVGTFLFTKYVTPILIAKKRGQIINIASIAGLTGFKNGTAYTSSKFAVVGFTESLREDLKQYGIAVTAICSGSVKTAFAGITIEEKSSRDYVLEPEDVARAVKFVVDESETANTKLIEMKPRRRHSFRG